ncbi:MAG: ACP S-malonyltransferase [Caldilineaceae bacterium SB0670_bin_27]|uniref:Malonyl CoA-acyl carrier protein transacylase n=1 Tax=Caldilineaceae bacterium SB0664_bin_27 TaxID=2605260 RepID=A0A6B0YZ44_9CHLR|nr:ACP S-malonyltransferase [Caldilineaceae bacterium SB0664_bin_27]MYJ79650.1 ACP S-malonyltransferase [Caldilineaceae bacterium SB0670_bin_27]
MSLALSYLPESSPLIFLFPGQGSQHVGMAKELAESYPAARAVFAEADEVLGAPISRICFEGPEDQLTDTINAQPALFAASMAALCAMQAEMGSLPRPAYFAGHSMGEYSALAAAGCIGFADGLRLVRERGRLMKEAGARQPGRMVAVIGLKEDVVSRICAEAAAANSGVSQIANDNCPGQIVISGDENSIAAAMSELEKAGARRVVPLAVSIAAHSPLMEPAASQLRARIDAIDVKEPLAPVIGNTSGLPLDSPAAICQELNAQLTGSVRWTDSMKKAVDGGVETAVEIGPGSVLTGLMKRIQRKGKRVNVSNAAEVRNFAGTFG